MTLKGTQCNEVLLSLGDTSKYDILGSMYREKLRFSPEERISKLHTFEELVKR